MLPLLSVLIPTRERARTLRYTIASALAQSSQAYEVIVSDNASADDTASVAASFADSRLRYCKTDQRLSMCDNYEFAFTQARGAYVIIIGDDDAVIPGALDRLLTLLQAASEPVVHMWPLHIYDWPADSRGARAAYLAPQVPPSELDLKSRARQVIARGGWKYYELPSPYHSAVPAHLLMSIRRETGRVFHSTQPDVFTAMAIPAFADRALNVGFTVTFNGRSAKSNGLGFIAKSARKNLTKFLGEYGDYVYHPSLYPGASGAANMIPDAILRARDLFPELYAGTHFGYESMWAYICRLGFCSLGEVIGHRTAIRHYHELQLPKLLGYAAVQHAAATRRRILDALTPMGSFAAGVPDNVYEFASILSTSSLARERI